MLNLVWQSMSEDVVMFVYTGMGLMTGDRRSVGVVLGKKHSYI